MTTIEIRMSKDLLYNGVLYALDYLAKNFEDETVRKVSKEAHYEIRRLKSAVKYWSKGKA